MITSITMESSFDFVGYFASLCDEPSNSNDSEVWFLEVKCNGSWLPAAVLPDLLTMLLATLTCQLHISSKYASSYRYRLAIN